MNFIVAFSWYCFTGGLPCVLASAEARSLTIPRSRRLAHGSKSPASYCTPLSVELPARTPWGCLARFSLARFFGKIPALFTAADSPVRPQTFQNHFGRGGDGPGILAVRHSQALDVLNKALDIRQLPAALDRRRELWQFQFAAQFKPLDHWLKAHFREALAEDASHRSANQLASDRIRPLQFAFVFKFQFAGDRRKRSIDVRDARNAKLFTRSGGSLLRIAHDALQRCDGKPLAHSRAAVHALVLACLKSNFFHDFSQILRHLDSSTRIPADPRFLMSDGHALGDARWIVRANLGADAILQWSDDLAACGVVLRIRGKHEEHIER